MKLEATHITVHRVTQRVSAGAFEFRVESSVHRDFDFSLVVGRLADPVDEYISRLIFVEYVARRCQCVADERSLLRQNHAVNAVLSPAQTCSDHTQYSVAAEGKCKVGIQPGQQFAVATFRTQHSKNSPW